jgi:hypothetical protein
MKSLFLGIVVLLIAGGTGCSISQSLGSLSDSVSTSSKSVSGSSESSSDSSESSSDSSAEDAAYRRDVSDYAYSFARNGGSLDAFQRGIAGLAEARGISNWEENPETCASIGLGFNRAGAGRDRLQQLGDDLFAENAAARSELQRGYDSLPEPRSVSSNR